MTEPTLIDLVTTAVGGVVDPEIRRPFSELGMVKSVEVDAAGVAHVAVWLTVSGCPMREEISSRVRAAALSVAGITDALVLLDVMSDEQRAQLRERLQGPARDIPFSRAGSLTKVFAIASGKGGVGKSSITANLAATLARDGLTVGVVDADIYGHSIPRMLGVTGLPHQVEGMIMPPEAHGIRVISMLPFKPGGISQPVAFRGPMLHRALEQFLADVWWGDLDVLLLDLPPGTGDVAISVAQLLPGAQTVVVTTPQPAAAEVAVRAGMLSQQTHSRVAGVIENMSGVPCPHCGQPMDLFGVGGGAMVAEQLSAELGTTIPVLGRVPFDVRLREGGDAGMPLVLSDPTSPAAEALRSIATELAGKPRGLAGMSLGITPSRKE